MVSDTYGSAKIDILQSWEDNCSRKNDSKLWKKHN